MTTLISRIVKSLFLSSLCSGGFIAASAAGTPANEFPAILEGHAILPAVSFIKAPSDSPASLKTSGKFTESQRVDGIGKIEGKSAGRPTGVFLPFDGQPLQGHSGIKHLSDGTYWVLTDNGAGSKANSPDFMLYLNQYQIDFKTGKVALLKTVFLNDAQKKVPFHITTEDSAKRYLTGADFDPESVQFAGGYLWIGEEFGPYLLQFDLNGTLVNLYETKVNDQVVRSPDHPNVRLPGSPAETVSFEVKRSKGFEGMAASVDGKKLYALLEGPLWQKDSRSFESIDGKEALRIIEFDVDKKAWTGRSWLYPLEQNGLAIGDFNMLDGTTGLIIERDNGEGVQAHACPQSQPATNCFHQLPQFKRVYKIELPEMSGQAVRKIGYIDLMKINDPKKVARKPLENGQFVFPFFTIENVDRVDADHIIVGNDNNLPFSSSRLPNQADDNEFILLKVTDFLKAK